MRTFLGVLAGLLSLAVTMYAVSTLGGQFVTPPPAVDPSDAEALRTVYASLADDMKALLVLSWFLGVFVGAVVAKSIAGRSAASWVVVGLFEILMLATVLMLVMPVWMQIAALTIPVVAGLIAVRIVKDRVFPAGEADTSEREPTDAVG